MCKWHKNIVIYEIYFCLVNVFGGMFRTPFNIVPRLYESLQREFPSNLYCAPHTEGRGIPTLSKIANCF